MPETAGPTLTQITFIGRQTVKFGSIALVSLIVGRMLWGSFSAYWRATHPTPPPPPTVGFGSLPQIDFPDQDTADKPNNYTLQLPTGRFPDFGDRAKVFFMPTSSPSLLDDQNARQLAANLGFVFEPEQITATDYRFTKAEPLPTTLEMEIVTQRFEMTSDYLSRPELISDENLPAEAEAVGTVKSALSAASLLPSDMATVSGKVTYMRAVGSELEPAASFSDATFAVVELNRVPIDGQYQFTASDGQAPIRAVISGALSGRDSIVELKYHYQPLEYEQVHTYPIRTAQDAWKVVQAGEAYVVESLGQVPESAVVRRVSLGYFESDDEQMYMQPVYIFTGDDNFMALVPALDPRFLQSGSN